MRGLSGILDRLRDEAAGAKPRRGDLMKVKKGFDLGVASDASHVPPRGNDDRGLDLDVVIGPFAPTRGKLSGKAYVRCAPDFGSTQSARGIDVVYAPVTDSSRTRHNRLKRLVERAACSDQVDRYIEARYFESIESGHPMLVDRWRDEEGKPVSVINEAESPDAILRAFNLVVVGAAWGAEYLDHDPRPLPQGSIVNVSFAPDVRVPCIVLSSPAVQALSVPQRVLTVLRTIPWDPSHQTKFIALPLRDVAPGLVGRRSVLLTCLRTVSPSAHFVRLAACDTPGVDPSAYRAAEREVLSSSESRTACLLPDIQDVIDDLRAWLSPDGGAP